MATRYSHFEGKETRPVVMAGISESGSRSHREKMKLLRKQREERENHRRRVDACVVLQRIYRGIRSRRKLQDQLCHEVERADPITVRALQAYSLLPTTTRHHGYLATVCRRVLANPPPFALHAFTTLCLDCIHQFAGNTVHEGAKLYTDVVDALSQEGHPSLRLAAARGGVFTMIRLAKAYHLVPRFFDLVVLSPFIAEIFWDEGYRRTPPCLLTGVVPDSPDIVAAMAEAVAEVDRVKYTAVLEKVVEVAREVPSVDFLPLIHPLARPLPGSYFPVGWYPFHSDFLSRLSSPPYPFLSTMLDKPLQLDARITLLTTLAFRTGFIPTAWQDSRVAPGPLTAAFHPDADTLPALHVFLLASSHLLECTTTVDPPVWDCLSTAAPVLTNIGARMLFYEGSTPAAVRDSLLVLLRKLHDLDTIPHLPKMNKQGWIITPPFPWPQNITLDDWRVQLKGYPMQRTYLVLQNMPFIIPFDARVLMFRSFVEQDLNSLGVDRAWGQGGEARIRRDHIFEDGYRALSRMEPDELKSKARVTFLSSSGAEEAGFGDGVFKEFLLELSKVVFNPKYGLFLTTEANELYPNPSSGDPNLYGDSHLDRYRFVGRVLGKALYEGILIDLPLAKFVRSALLGKGVSNSLHDLHSLDPELYRNLLQMKSMSADEIESLGLVFAVTEGWFGKTTQIDLVDNGANIPVTIANRIQYIHLMAHYKVSVQIAPQIRALKEGMQDVMSPTWLQMFDAGELQVLLSGHDQDQGLDVDNWQENTVYGGGYTADHHTIRIFWEVVRDLTPEDQRRLLKFATSVDRAPLLGFAYLHPKFCIHMGGDPDRLPSASTCMCLLKLPPYANKPVMRERLTTAIQHDTGFELS